MERKKRLPSAEAPALSFGDLLRAYRRRARLTQEELAERAGISSRAVSDLERGINKTAQRQTVALLATALNLSPEEREELESHSSRRSIERRRSNASVRSSYVPQPPTSLVGRKRDIEEAVHRLRWGGVRLLTLIGPGGVGKTRVAIALTQALRADSPDTPLFVSLAPIRDVQLVPATIAIALQLVESARKSHTDQLVDHLRDSQKVLVLDNFEHVLDGASVVSRILHECPLVTVIATSRVPLRLQGEHRMEIAPLEVPGEGDPAELERAARFPAVDLFIQRARAARRDFAASEANIPTIVEICRRLDGLPLAIELAAARAAHLSPQALLMRLSSRLGVLTDGAIDLPSRHQTMRDAIAWSYELLAPEDQGVARRLSVFAGGWTLEAAEAVGENVADALGRLIDSSLVVVERQDDGEFRYRMLETVREFLAEQLSANGETEEARQRHARYFLGLAETAEPALIGPEQVSWLDRLEREHDNLRAALSWASSVGEVDIGLRMCAALWRFWLERGHTSECRQWLQTFLPQSGRGASQLSRSKALYAAGALGFEEGRSEEALESLEAALAIDREMGDDSRVAAALNGLGVVFTSMDSYDRALKVLTEAVELRRRLGDEAGLGSPLNNIANILRYQGKISEASTIYEEVIEIHRRSGNLSALASTLNNLALAFVDTGDHAESAARAQESLALYDRLENPMGRSQAVTTLATLAMDSGEYAQARPLVEESLELMRQAEDAHGTGIALVNLSTLELRDGRTDRAESLARESLQLFETRGNDRLLAYSVEAMGDVAQSRGQLERAEELYRRALELRRGVPYASGIITALERLASLAAVQDNWHACVRTYAAAATLRGRHRIATPAVMTVQRERDLERAIERLGSETYERERERGTREADEWLPHSGP